MMNQYNPAMMQMTPYGLQQQPQAPMNGGYGQQGGVNGGYGQQGGVNGGMMMGNGGMAGPGQMLQIQAAPGYQHQQGNSGDPFSAFDGL